MRAPAREHTRRRCNYFGREKDRRPREMNIVMVLVYNSFCSMNTLQTENHLLTCQVKHYEKQIQTYEKQIETYEKQIQSYENQLQSKNEKIRRLENQGARGPRYVPERLENQGARPYVPAPYGL